MIFVLASTIITIFGLFLLQTNQKKILSLSVCYLGFLFLTLSFAYENKIAMEMVVPILGLLIAVFGVNLLMFSLIIRKMKKREDFISS